MEEFMLRQTSPTAIHSHATKRNNNENKANNKAL